MFGLAADAMCSMVAVLFIGGVLSFIFGRFMAGAGGDFLATASKEVDKFSRICGKTLQIFGSISVAIPVLFALYAIAVHVIYYFIKNG